MVKRIAFVLMLVVFTVQAGRAGPVKDGVIEGELKKWHRVAVTFEGPDTDEQAEPNPFLDYRLDVTFSKGEKRHRVAGFYAGDGNAAETSATGGNKWRVCFSPDEAGKWRYKARFRSGEKIAISSEPNAGKSAGFFDGATGEFEVGPTDKKGRDFRRRGRLCYVGGRYLQFAETGEYFLKGGADSPENFLAYFEFDGTYDTQGLRREGEARGGEFIHRYRPHRQDWREEDAVWQEDKGKNIIGALNYLAGQGMNSVYFLTYNVDGGDGKDVWPWTGPGEKLRFDCSKLAQWEVVFSHMDRVGLAMHVVTQETENDQGLDGGELGVERRLYYRELIARFGHHPAVVWNLGEENTNTDAQRKAFADYIQRLDAYSHPIVVHTYPGAYEKVYRPLLGYVFFEGPSLQMGDVRRCHAETVKWVRLSGESGRQWFVCVDEIGPASRGVLPDEVDAGHDLVRQQALWGNLMGGGAGCEWYFGYEYADNDLNCEDWRSRERMWEQTRFALEFMRGLPVGQMEPADGLVSRGWCLARKGEVYAVYLPEGGAAGLEVGGGRYAVRWFNPREGGDMQRGSVEQVSGPGKVLLGEPAADPERDWAVVVRLVDNE